MGERLDPETVRELMLRYFHEMRGAIERHGGTVEKFAGDAVMAAFGVPIAHEDDALRAVRAAAEMRERLEELNPTLEHAYGARLGMRIGVNTGEVVASPSAQRDTFVTGDPVNTAARLEQAAAEGEILLGELTYELAQHGLLAERAADVDAKGKAQPVATYRLVSVSRGIPPIPRPKTPLIGRTRELAKLERLFEQAAAGRRCTLATIVGEPGVGKSRLAAEFVSQLGASTGVYTGRCLSYGEGITYWPLGEIVRHAASIHDDDTPDVAREKINVLVDYAAGGRIASAIGLNDASFTADEIAGAFGSLFEALAVARPLVALIEDVHWAEMTLLDLFRRIAARSKSPILVLCTARPELVQQQTDWPVSLQLEPLTQGETEHLLDVFHLPDRARAKVAETARGNPLFAEELAAYLRERSGDEAIPLTLNALLNARLDLLTEPERAAAERGSIEGEVFHRGPLADLSGIDVAQTLAGLVDRGLIAPAQAVFVGEAAYRFKHVLVRDAVYNGAPKRLRAELHERFADWLEHTAGDRTVEYEEILGYHLERAYRFLAELGPIDEHGTRLARRAAIDYLIPAGSRAGARADDSAVVSLLGRAASLLPPDDPQRLEFIPVLGMGLQMIGEFEKAEALLSEAIAVAVARGDSHLAARARLQRWWSYSHLGLPGGSADDAEREARAAIRVFEEAGDERNLAGAWSLRAAADEIRSRSADAQAAKRRAIHYATEAGDLIHAAYMSADLVQGTEFDSTPVEEALRLCEEMTERVTIDRLAVAKTFTARAHLSAMQGSFDQARVLVRRASAIVEDLGLIRAGYGPSMAIRRAQVELLAGDPVAAEGELRPAYERLLELEASADTRTLYNLALMLAEALYAQKRYAEAVQLVRLAEGADAGDAPLGEAARKSLQAKLMAVDGEITAAEALAREAVGFTAATDLLKEHADRVFDLGETLRVGGRSAEAVRALEEALQLYERKGDIASAAKTRALLDEMRAATALT
jgi:class 3 adenylate cyclase/tetratricopeptide (TPR) repeat protein